MEQYIPKSVLVAEIEKEIKNIYAGREYVGIPYSEECIVRGLQKAEDIINTLEVKEVDFEKSISDWLYYEGLPNDEELIDYIKETAEHFFELGLFSTITEEDCKLIWNIGDSLPYMPEEDFFKELLRRFKAQKGREV